MTEVDGVSDTMRLFFAIAIPDEVAEGVLRAQDYLRRRMACPTIRWARRDQFHYTVKFLGEQPMPKARKAVEAAERVCEVTRPFVLTLDGIGAFPSRQRPSVLWIGASAGAAEFAALARSLDDALARERFRKETREPSAHLTIARLKTYEAEAAAAKGLTAAHVGEIGSLTADHLVLMRSLLRPTGSEYAVVERFPFKAKPNPACDGPALR